MNNHNLVVYQVKVNERVITSHSFVPKSHNPKNFLIEYYKELNHNLKLEDKDATSIDLLLDGLRLFEIYEKEFKEDEEKKD